MDLEGLRELFPLLVFGLILTSPLWAGFTARRRGLVKLAERLEADLGLPPIRSRNGLHFDLEVGGLDIEGQTRRPEEVDEARLEGLSYQARQGAVWWQVALYLRGAPPAGLGFRRRDDPRGPPEGVVSGPVGSPALDEHLHVAGASAEALLALTPEVRALLAELAAEAAHLELHDHTLRLVFLEPQTEQGNPIEGATAAKLLQVVRLAEALARVETGPDALRALALHAETPPVLRRRAAELLGAASPGTPAAADTLRQLRQDRDPAVRVAAARALGPNHFVDLLWEIRAAPLATRRSMLKALAAEDDPRLLPLLRTVLPMPEAVAAVRRAADPADVPLLAASLASATDAELMAVVEALDALGPAPAEPALLSLLRRPGLPAPVLGRLLEILSRHGSPKALVALRTYRAGAPGSDQADALERAIEILRRRHGDGEVGALSIVGTGEAFGAVSIVTPPEEVGALSITASRPEEGGLSLPAHEEVGAIATVEPEAAPSEKARARRPVDASEVLSRGRG